MKLKFVLAVLAVLTLGLIQSARVEAHPATGIVVDRAGNVYFSDLETIWKLDTSNQLTVFRAGVSGTHVHELAIDDQDNIYGADISYESATQKWISDVWKMTPERRLNFLLEPTTNPPRGMSQWRDREGNMYLIDQNNHTKTKTLLLKRSPDGKVITFAGGAYGHADGKGSAAKFSSVGGMAFGPDGSLYLSDGASVRKVALDGNVVTVANCLDARTGEDHPTLFGGAYGNLSGLTVDSAGNVYVADAGNRRLFKISRDGKADVFLRTDPPYFPNGVAVGPDGDIFVLEVGFTLPSSWSGPRVLKIAPDGKSTLLATLGAEGAGGNLKASVARGAGASAESFLSFFLIGERIKYGAAILSVLLFCAVGLAWRRRRQRV